MRRRLGLWADSTSAVARPAVHRRSAAPQAARGSMRAPLQHVGSRAHFKQRATAV